MINKYILSKFSPTDAIIILYYFVTGLFIAIAACLGKLANWRLYIAHHAIVLVLLPIFVSWATIKSNKIVLFFRTIYPLLLFGQMYRETHDIDQILLTQPLDRFFADWDAKLFGFQPSVEFATHFHWRWLSEFMHAAYFSYFIIIAILPLVWWLRKKPEMAHRRVFDIAFTFSIFYTIFILLPVQGPRVQLPEAIAIPRVGYVFAPFFEWLFTRASLAGAAFPSSHCGVATVVLINSFDDLPKYRYIVAFSVFMLYLSTVYGRFHYAIDVFYGIGLGIICSVSSPYIFSFLKRMGFSAMTSTKV